MSRKGRAYLVQLDRRLSTQPVPVRHPAAHAFTRPALSRAFCHGSSGLGRGRLREYQDFLRFQGPRPYLCVPQVVTRDVNRRPTSNSGRPGLPRAPGTSHTVRVLPSDSPRLPTRAPPGGGGRGPPKIPGFSPADFPSIFRVGFDRQRGRARETEEAPQRPTVGAHDSRGGV